MKEAFRAIIFFAVVLGLFIWAVQVIDWLITEERTYRKQTRNERRHRRYE